MATIKGTTVYITVREQSGTDGFGRPTYTEVLEPVENVLIQPVSTEDAVAELNLSGKHILYNLGIPKGDTHDWENTKVTFFGKVFKTVGIPLEGIEEMIPLQWHKKVKVELYE